MLLVAKHTSHSIQNTNIFSKHTKTQIIKNNKHMNHNSYDLKKTFFNALIRRNEFAFQK